MWSGIFHNFFEVIGKIVLNWQILSKVCAEFLEGIQSSISATSRANS